MKRCAHRYWVRSEDQIRREFFNKHQLRLLQICYNHLKVLFTQADKIHQGISLDDQDDVTRYQLPNDLVDCFEATALFVMQCVTSLEITEHEMFRWQHVPGIPLGELKIQAIEVALARLGELIQSAQASMTRAEKTLALSDPETNMLSMGAAGPELLVCVIIHNIQNKRLLKEVDMDVNQLYQECTSKLVSRSLMNINYISSVCTEYANINLAISDQSVPAQTPPARYPRLARRIICC
jgi:hypothetical protein